MNTFYQLPTWAETTLVICVALMLAALGVWMMCKAVTEAVNAASRLEAKRTQSDTKALNRWQKLYEEEHQKRADDNAALIVISLHGFILMPSTFQHIFMICYPSGNISGLPNILLPVR